MDNTPGGNPETFTPMSTFSQTATTTATSICAEHQSIAQGMPSKDLPLILSTIRKMPTLTQSNWISWKARITDMLEHSKAEQIVTGEFTRPDEKDHKACAEKWDELSRAGYSIIMNGLDDDEVQHLCELHGPIRVPAHEIWKILQKSHEAKGSVSRMGVLHDFMTTRASEDVDVVEHIEKMKKCQVQLESLGRQIPEEDFKTQIIMTLPLSWEHYAESSFATDGNINNINITSHEMIMHIQGENERRKRWKADAEKETAYQAIGKSLMKRISDPPANGGRVKHQKTLRSICKRPNHKEANCFFRQGAPRCTYCGKPGHSENDCWSKNGRKGKKKGKGRTRPKRESANVATMSNRSSGVQEVHVTYDSRSNSETPSIYYWHADSAATCHVTNDYAALTNYIPKMETIRGLGNVEVQSYGRGTVKLKSKIGNQSYKITLRGVYYVPSQTDSLLSIRRLDQQGGSAYIGNSQILIYDRHKNAVATGRTKRNQYQLDVQTVYPERVEITQEKLSWDLWHARYGHVSHSGLRKLFQRNLVDNFNVDINSVPTDCTVCAKNKLTRENPRQKLGGIKTKLPGELTHTDVWGPTSSVSENGMSYFLTCIDDYSRYVTVYFLKQKNEAGKKITEHLTMLQTKYRSMPGALRADNGKEYVNQALTAWCNEWGIGLQFTAPYMPQQNGVAERFNRTLVELARTMRTARNIPKNLWPTAVAHAAYLQNRAYTSAVKTQTPYERWNHKKPDVAHLREYGSPVVVLIEGEKVSELDPKAQEHLFLGFEDETSSINYYDARTHHVKRSHNYRFINPQSEGELGSGTLSGGEQRGENLENQSEIRLELPAGTSGKRVREEPELEPRRSKRPRVVHDYSKLDNPLSELVQVMKEGEEIIPLDVAEMIYAALADADSASDDPRTLEEAQASPDWPEWQKVIKTELEQLENMGTWKLEDAPSDRKPVANKWVFIKKFNKDGTLKKYKARLVAKGFSQIPGMDFNQTFAPVVRFETI
ncbi:hypothetical protein AX15_005211 [Amanita polypyramis BW_CC]|nr:hypothetical protein AX15_005211 [Amanita polypyramis BW_CC]